MSEKTTTTPTTKREKFDFKRPDARAIADAIVHGAFITEGTMVAFPTCFPAVTVPLPGDESRLTALAVARDGMLYAGTSGRAVHLLVGMFHGVTGMVFDMGTVPGATRCVGVVCGTTRLAAAANGPRGGTLIGRKLERLPFDLIQEWHVARQPLEPIAAPLNGEPVVHLLQAGAQHANDAIAATPTRLLRMDLAGASARVIAEAPTRGELAVSDAGAILGRDDDDSLWRLDVATERLERHAIKLPGADWPAQLRFARDTIDGTLYTADDAGNLYSFGERSGFSGPLAQVPTPPVGPMAVTLDGRVYGTFGDEMSMLFVYNPAAAGTPEQPRLRTLGVAVSTLERRRYGYSFAAAATGRDGQLYFGEDDDLGHIWIYFPAIQPKGQQAVSR